jgi:hypothetical protein
MPEGATPSDVGAALLTELLAKLGAVIHQSEVNRELMIDMRDLLAEDIDAKKRLAQTLDELSGRLEVFSVASGICVDIANGKKSVSLADFCHAVVQAEEEIFPDEDDGDGDVPDDDPDDKDPVVGGPRSRRV